jgi:hypothetical protein
MFQKMKNRAGNHRRWTNISPHETLTEYFATEFTKKSLANLENPNEKHTLSQSKGMITTRLQKFMIFYSLSYHQAAYPPKKCWLSECRKYAPQKSALTHFGPFNQRTGVGDTAFPNHGIPGGEVPWLRWLAP